MSRWWGSGAGGARGERYDGRTGREPPDGSLGEPAPRRAGTAPATMSRVDHPAPAPEIGDVDAMERALGWRPLTFRQATTDRGGGATAARWIVADDRGRSAFVKIGATPLTAEWIRTEHRNYRAVRGSFLPEVLGFDDRDGRPALALEDLSSADWPPPWDDVRIGMVLDAMSRIHATPAPRHVKPYDFDGWPDWRAVVANPEPFLSVGLCSRAWLVRALPELIEATDRAPLEGSALVHLDVRSDNLCFRDGRAVILDWNHAARANPDLDVAFWLPSLEAEGGPPPERILPDAPGIAAWVAGYFCARAGEAPFPDAPHVRPLQRMQARTALPWAARALGLPPP